MRHDECRRYGVFWSVNKKYRKAVRWCASLIRSLYWLIRLIWIGFLDLWVDLTDLVYLIGWLNNRLIDSMSYSKSKYLMVANFMGYYTRIKIPHGCRYHETLHQNKKYLMVADFMRYYTRINISHGCRFREILHQDQHISWLQISWDITPGLTYLMVADFVRY